jgi:hypothetical protein
MHYILRNILAAIVGLITGSIVNMGIITISTSVIPPPEGADVTTMEGLQASMDLFEPKHFIMPFLAHSLGTFVGAFIAALIAFNHKMKFALGIACFFLIGGIMMVYQLPSPTWFNIVDITLAYLPFAYVAGKLASKQK